MLASLSLLACALYLVPLTGLVIVLRDERGSALDLACAVGCAFACDLLGSFVLTYLFRVEAVAFVRTGLLLALVAGIAVRRSRQGAVIIPPLRRLSRGDLAALAFAAGIAFLFSMMVSSEYWMWDREWHVPFASSLRVQRMPFRNVYDPRAALRYHLAGDLFAALLQSLSFATMNASRALSLAHDLQSAIAGGIVALLLRALCRWPPATAALASMVPLLAGPMTFRSKNQGSGLGPFEGDADFNNFTLSFRPHCMIAGIILVALFGHVARMARDRMQQRAPGWEMLAMLAPLVALGSITDEISSVMVGLALAGLWLGWPDLFGAPRWRGVMVLFGLATAALLANFFLAGTIAPGGPIEHARWLAPRLPRFAAAAMPLGLDREGWKLLLLDEGSMIIPALVVIYSLWRDRRTENAILLPALFVVGVTAAGLALFLCFEVNGRTYEGHRFVTAGRFLVPLIALVYSSRSPRASLVSIVLLAPVMAGVFSSVGFVFYRLPQKGIVNLDNGQYQTDCRNEFGAHLGEPIVPSYVDEPIWYLYAGCRPIFAAGHDGPPGVVLAGFPKLGPDGFAKMDRSYFSSDQPARVVCPKDAALATPLCKKAQTLGPCDDAGSAAIVCSIPPAVRSALGTP